MIRAIVRAGVGSRSMLVAAAAFGCAVLRCGAWLGGDRPWAASELHDGATFIVLALMVPTFVALLGSMLLRGEHAPWSWAFARPVSRVRVVLVLATFDALAIAACVGVAAVLLGGFGELVWRGTEGIAMKAALPVLYVLLYCATAIGGARGMSALRSGALGLVWLAGLLGLGSLVAANTYWLFRRMLDVDDQLRLMTNAYSYADSILMPLVWGTFVIGLSSLAVVLIGVAIPFVRAAASVPAAPRWRALVLPPLVAFAVCSAVAAATAAIARTQVFWPE